ncbi:acyl-CoA N-acyltransferase [Lophiotrema nucula]|uniref:Acyl-CoA N-acyltransferase n=1 Tax=Lophiotrema nucula TaxID=690887 RepID=A0A6A5ZCD5_9PLEO|nr:acyl-CoA N-acyltransferase [Lophiotrema nucula]
MAELQNYIVRPAKSLKEATDLWWPLMSELGWNRDLDDGKTHYHVARNGNDWLLLTNKDTEKPEGCVVAFTYPNGTGWVGFFCVNAPLRQQGLGRTLWTALEASFHASGTSVIGLDGVEQQVNTYKRRGFKDCAKIHLMVRPSLQEKALSSKVVALGEQDTVVDIRSVDFEALAKLDLALNGLDRTALWTEEALFSRKDTYGFALENGTELSGFVLVRRCEDGHRIGPLYARTYSQAVHLLHLAMAKVSGSKGDERKGSFVAEVFGTNPVGKTLFEELGWAWAGLDYHRMWLDGKIPKEQADGGRGTEEMFATFDAAEG